MRRARPTLIAVGLLLAAAGLFVLLQRRGLIRWPRQSFMVDDPSWVTYGAALAVAGLLLVLLARRLR